MYNRIYLIGVGGIGSNLAPSLAKLLAYSAKDEPYGLVLIDGDRVEEKNLKRQGFYEESVGQFKADFIRREISRPNVDVSAITTYIGEDNVSVIQDSSIVILAVDNNKTRHLVQKHCLTLTDVVLINGGNEIFDGSINVYYKRKGQEIIPPIWTDQPRIEHPSDLHPNERHCEEQYEEDPQIFATNNTVAAHIINVLTPILNKQEVLCTEIFFDIRSGLANAKWTKSLSEIVKFTM